MKTAFTLFIICFFNYSSFAQPGTLDSSFGVSGKVITLPPKYNLQCSAFAPQSDGSIIATGTINSIGFFAIKYFSNGELDLSFGINGLASINKIGEALSMAVQPDDKILVGGYYAKMFEPYYVSIARFNANGTIDSSFGNKGNIFISGETRCMAIAIQPDKKILIEGDDNKANVLTMRLLPNGTTDSTFGTNGVAKSFYGLGNTIAIQKNGKIVVGGRSDLRLFFARYNINGTFDSTFGTDGRVFYDYGTGTDIINDLTIQPDGKIIGVGTSATYYPDTLNSILVRCQPDGSLDESFCNACLNGQKYKSKAILRSVVLQKDGKILTCGSILDKKGNGYFLLARFTIDGMLDHSFGNNGYQSTAFDYVNSGQSLFLQKDGKIVVGGVTETTKYQLEIALARYNNDEVKKIKHYVATHNNAQATSLNNVSIYPNPVQNVLHVAGLLSNKSTLTVIDFVGNVKLQAVANTSSYNLNIAALTPGNYLLKIEMNDTVVTKKFVKE